MSSLWVRARHQWSGVDGQQKWSVSVGRDEKPEWNGYIEARSEAEMLSKVAEMVLAPVEDR